MTRIPCRTLLMVVALAAGVRAAGPTPREVEDARAFLKELVSPTPLAPKVKARIQELLTHLGDNAWRVREDATKELVRIGPKAKALVLAVMTSKDLEVKTRAQEILTAYQDAQVNRSSQVSLAADVLAGVKDKTVLDALVHLLDHPDGDIRHAVEYGLRRLTGRQFGYNANDETASRAAAAAKWKAWWKDARGDFRFERAMAMRTVEGILTCDMMQREVFIVGLDGKMIWSKKLTKRPYAATAAPNGNVVVSFYENGKASLEEYTRAGKMVWSTAKLDRPLRVVQDLSRLANGNTLALDASTRQLIEIDPGGKKVVWQQACGTMSAMALQRLANGNTLVCQYNQVREITKEGKVVWTRGGFSSSRDAQALPNGNILVAEYSRNRVIEITRAGKEVWTWTDNRGTSYRPVSARRLPDGRTVVHARTKGLLLIDSSGKLIRTLLEARPRSYEKVRLVYRHAGAGSSATTQPAATQPARPQAPTTRPAAGPATRPAATTRPATRIRPRRLPARRLAPPVKIERLQR